MNTFKKWRKERNNLEILDEALLASAMTILKKLISKVSSNADKMALKRIHAKEGEIGLIPNKDKLILVKVLIDYDVADKELAILKKTYLKEDFDMNEESKKVQYIPAESAAIGRFTEKENGHFFEIYPLMKNDSYAKQIKATHMIHVGTRKFSREYLRYVKLKKTVVDVAVDEAGGKPIWEKWHIKQRYAYEENIEQLKVANQYIINPI